MSSTHLMEAFDSSEDWQDDRRQPQQSQRGGLLNFLSRSAPSHPVPTQDAVFGNLLAKDDSPRQPVEPVHDEETTPQGVPPTYEEAANDNAPSYWETTIMASGWCDDVLVDELPVGSNIQLIWNMLLSFAFGIGGFIGTYLVHTTHASKAGSILGLALNLLQTNYDFSSGPQHAPSHHDPDQFRPTDPNSYNDTPSQTGHIEHGSELTGVPEADASPSSAGISWLTTVIALLLIYYALVNYMRVYRIKLAVLAQNEAVSNPEPAAEITTVQTNAAETTVAGAPEPDYTQPPPRESEHV